MGGLTYDLVTLLAIPLLAHCAARVPPVPHHPRVSSQSGAGQRALPSRDVRPSSAGDQASCVRVSGPSAREIQVSPSPARGTLTRNLSSIVAVSHVDACWRYGAGARAAAAVSVPPPLRRPAILQVLLL